MNSPTLSTLPTAAPPAVHARQRVAVIGGGWAGMAAAVHACAQGHHVTVLEAARQWGGRARAMEIAIPSTTACAGVPQPHSPAATAQAWTVDNGQHILIGAYAQCLGLMRAVGIDPATALLRMPLDLRDTQGQGLRLPLGVRPPWDVLWGIACARGWRWGDRLALLRRAARWQWQGFACNPGDTVADLCHGLPAVLMASFIEPLCVSALNLPSAQASGAVFLRVLRDALLGGPGASHLLIPRVDLGELFPTRAAQWLQGRGAVLHTGRRVQSLAPLPAPVGQAGAAATWQVDGQVYDRVILATASAEAARLVQGAAASAGLLGDVRDSLARWAASAAALPHTAIATVYVWTPPLSDGADGDAPPAIPAGSTGSPVAVLSAPMVALPSTAQAPAQFAFDRGQLGGPAGLLALVVSDCRHSHDTLEARVLEQVRTQLGLVHAVALKTVVDKRAAFACTPGVVRPHSAIAPGLRACGDYVYGPYPATLEGAVRSGLEAAA